MGISRAHGRPSVEGRIALLVVALVAAALLHAAPAGAYTFGEPGVSATGPPAVVFDWSAQKCASDDIPDQPTRAFRDSTGQVVVINSHHTVRRYTGPALDSVVHRCNIVMGSGKSSNPATYDNREWLATTFTPDGNTVYGLIHNEYQGWDFGPGYCIKPGELFEDKMKCWYNVLTFTKSTNRGATFSHTAAPTHYAAGPPYQYAAGIGPIGFFQPSNIVRGRDGYHYLLTHVEDHGAQGVGSCLLRSNRLDDPSSWRAWDGTGFSRRFRDPYLFAYPPEEGACAPVAGIGTLSESLTWSTYLKKWVLVGSADNADGFSGPGFYYFTSNDLVNWTTARLVMGAELPWTYTCQDGPEQVRDPSLLDGDSSSRNFDTIGQRPFVFFTRFNITHSSPTSCTTSLDRDLIRIPLEFSNQQPGGPSATLSVSSRSPQAGEAVTFDASGSADADGAITRYEWDLDGDGTYERNTGTDPVTRRSYPARQEVTVTLRVWDDEGKATDETAIVRVGEPGPAEQEAAAAGGNGPVTAGAVAATIGRIAGPRRVRGGTRGALLRIRVPAAGTIRARPVAGRRLVRGARASVAGQGVVRLRVAPTRAGLTQLRRHGRVRVRMAVAFTPVGGARQSLSVRVLLWH